MSLEEIKSKFENKSYFIRGEFIYNYDFQDDYFEYYRSFILNFNYKIKNSDYVSDIIDLARYLCIFEDTLYNVYMHYLNKPFHTLSKLSIIDYAECRNKEFNDVNLEYSLRLLLHKRNNIILKNQLLVSLFIISEEKDYYFRALLKSLSKTNDWRSIYRVLRDDDFFLLQGKYQERVLAHIIKLHTKKDFGNGVSQLIVQRTVEFSKTK